jgi:DNA-binding transcriptional LysR family regulator
MLYDTGFKMMLEVAKYKSFTKAAHTLGVSGAAVSKQVKSLEHRLGLVLFHRTTRTVSLTEAGTQIVEALSRSNDEVSGLLEKLAERQERPSGKLKINAPMAFGESFLVGPIADYACLYPDVIVDVEFNDERVHLVEEGYDLIIRIGTLEDSGLIAKRLCDFPAHLCASPAFLKQHGTPEEPDDLRGIPAVIYTKSSTGPLLELRDPRGIEYTVPLTPAIFTNSIAMLLESAIKGLGFAQLPSVFCHKYIEDGTLKKLLPKFTSMPKRGIYIIYPDRRYLPMKVRSFIDLVEKHLS